MTLSLNFPQHDVPDLCLTGFDLLNAAEVAALNCSDWFGRGSSKATDAAACDAIRRMCDRTDMRGEIFIGDRIKNGAPGLFASECVGASRYDAPRLNCAIDPLNGTTNLSQGLNEYPAALVHHLDAKQVSAMVLRDTLNWYDHHSSPRTSLEPQGAC